MVGNSSEMSAFTSDLIDMRAKNELKSMNMIRKRAVDDERRRRMMVSDSGKSH